MLWDHIREAPASAMQSRMLQDSGSELWCTRAAGYAARQVAMLSPEPAATSAAQRACETHPPGNSGATDDLPQACSVAIDLLALQHHAYTLPAEGAAKSIEYD